MHSWTAIVLSHVLISASIIACSQAELLRLSPLVTTSTHDVVNPTTISYRPIKDSKKYWQDLEAEGFQKSSTCFDVAAKQICGVAREASGRRNLYQKNVTLGSPSDYTSKFYEVISERTHWEISGIFMDIIRNFWDFMNSFEISDKFGDRFRPHCAAYLPPPKSPESTEPSGVF